MRRGGYDGPAEDRPWIDSYGQRPKSQAFRMSADSRNGNSKRILLASEGRDISAAAIAEAAKLALENRCDVHVLTVARIWGSAFGLQHPGLFPTKREIDQQRAIVQSAIDQLAARNVNATGEVVRSRSAAKAIAKKAKRSLFQNLVMTADPASYWSGLGLFWSHEPYRVRRFCDVPVHLIIERPPQKVQY